ncbi:ADP-ribosylation [Pisolithus albus]|nr:ADP-ribosylation [Pisolithus albus]
MGILPQDDWVDVPPLDEFSLDNAANSVHGRKNRLLLINRENHRFSEVEQLFRKGWRHRKKNRPQVQLIFKVLWPESMLEPYLAYRSSVQQTVRAKDMRGNEQLLFHGTDRACLLAETRNNVVLCSLQKCSMCSILRTSFEVKRCGKSILFTFEHAPSHPYDFKGSKNAFKRFGHGIYTTSCSSKADDYTSNLSNEASLRVMLVSRVVVGKPYKRYRNAVDLIGPPLGYHSIAGEIGWDLNYDETVTYRNETIRPAYLVVYGEKEESPVTVKEFISSMFKTPLAS